MMTINTALTIAMILTVVGVICACIRLILGPSRADRVVSLDLLTILLVAIAAQLAILYDVAAYLDLGLAIGLIGFLATVAFARYIEQAEQLPNKIREVGEAEKLHAQSTSDSQNEPINPTEGDGTK